MGLPLMLALAQVQNTRAGSSKLEPDRFKTRKASAAMMTMGSGVLAEQEQECVNELAGEVETIWHRYAAVRG